MGSQHTCDLFDWFQAAAHGSQAPVTVKVTDGASNAFSNRQGRVAVWQRAEHWLITCFSMSVCKESSAHTSHREPRNSDNDFEDRKQRLKV